MQKIVFEDMEEKKLEEDQSLGSRNLMKMYLMQNWLSRKVARYKRRELLYKSRIHELKKFEKTVHALNPGAGAAWTWA